MLPMVKVGLATLLLGLGVGVLIGYEWGRGKPPEQVTVQLPPKTVIVTVVKEIKVPGPGHVVEHIKLVTKTVEVPVEKIKEVLTAKEVVGRVRLDANKFEGLENGKPHFGWKGNAICELSPKQEPLAWVKLVESPFDLTESYAETTVGPTVAPKPLRLDLGAGISTDGALVQVGLAKRLTRKTFLGRALLPDWVGVSGSYSALGHASLLVTASREF